MVGLGAINNRWPDPKLRFAVDETPVAPEKT